MKLCLEIAARHSKFYSTHRLNISKNIFYNLLSQLPQILSGLIVSIFSTRILGPEGKGVFGVLTSDILLFGLIMNLGIQMATGYFISSKQTEPRKILGVGIYHWMINLILLGGAFGVLYQIQPVNILIPRMGAQWLPYAYVFASFSLNYMNTLLNAIFIGSKKFRYINQSLILKAFSDIVFFSILYYLHLQSELGMQEVMGAFFLVIALQSLFWIISYMKEFGEAPQMNKGVIAQVSMLLGFSLIGYLSNLLNFLNYRLDLWVVEYFTTIDQVGFYVFAVNLTQMMWLISDPIAGILKPNLADPDVKDRVSIFSAFQRANATIILIISLIAWLIADLLITLLYGSEFSASILPFKILLIGNFFACSSKVFAVYNVVTNNIKFNLQATAFGLMLTVIFDLLFIPENGIIGAAWASNIAYFGTFAYLVLVCRFKLDLKINNLFLFTKKDLQFLQ